MEKEINNTESKPEKKLKDSGSGNTLKNGILSIIGSVFHKLVTTPMMIFGGFSTYMISYLRYYQEANENPISLNYTYFIMPIISITMGFGIPFSGVLEFKLGTKLAIVYSSLFLILSSVIQYFSKRIVLNLFAIFIYAVGASLSVALTGKNACMYFPTRRGMISGILALISSAFSSALNILGEKIIINPNSIDPINSYYIYDVSKNIRNYFLFQIGMVFVFTIICILFIVQYNTKNGTQKTKNKKDKKDDNLIDKDTDKKEPLMPEEKDSQEKGGEEKKEVEKNKEEIEVNEEKKEVINNKEEINVNEEKKESQPINNNELYDSNGLESSIDNTSANYSMNQVKIALRSFRVWRLFLMGIFGCPLNNFIGITWRPISIYKNMPTNKIQVVNSYTSIVQMFANPLFGFLADKIPYRIMKVVLCTLNCVVGFLFYFSFKNVYFFTLLIILNNLAVCGFVSINGPHYMKVFGMKHFIEISGIIALSNVIMGPICSLLAFILEQKFKDDLDTVYKYMFLISSSLLFLDIGLSSFETEELLFKD